jgi:hypothetical protein
MGSVMCEARHPGDRTMSQAHEILSVASNANDACTRAEALTDSVDQDWSREATLYTFSDESVLVVSGPQVNAFGSMTEAREALEA